MKMMFTDLMGVVRELYDSQPTEVRQTIIDSSNCIVDEDVKTVLDYLSNEETQYVTYSHS